MSLVINSIRRDPYTNFKFLVYFEGQEEPVCAVSKVSALKRTTEVVSHRHGGDPNRTFNSPGQSSFEPITLERGVTTNREFEAWANRTYAPIDNELGPNGYKRTMTVVLLNNQGEPAAKYIVEHAWVSEYTAMAELDASANAVLIESVVVQNEGWHRDTDFTSPELPDPTIQPPS
jgi:phage tail-like protein